MLKPKKLFNHNFLSSLDLSNDEVIHILNIACNLNSKNLLEYKLDSRNVYLEEYKNK